MTDSLTVYGATGSGSVAVEAALRLLGLPYTVIEAPTWTGEDARALVRPINPLAQAPTVVFPDGEVMTESAALLIWLGDLKPEKRLAPAADAPLRRRYLRWMAYVPAQIYPMYLLKDDPTVWLHGTEPQEELRERAIERIKTCWKVMDEALEPDPWLLGERFSLLDLYVAVVSRWTPRRLWFEDACPKLASVVRRVDAMPELTAFWDERFPFTPGWRGDGA
jgi:GST-like protein